MRNVFAEILRCPLRRTETKKKNPTRKKLKRVKKKKKEKETYLKSLEEAALRISSLCTCSKRALFCFAKAKLVQVLFEDEEEDERTRKTTRDIGLE